MAPPHLILMGRVAGAFGVRGELRVTAYGDDPLSLLAYRDFQRKDGSPALSLASGRAAKGALIARAREVQTREDAEALRGLELYLPREALPPPDEDEFYLADLIGLEARDGAGTRLGLVKGVQDFGAGDLVEIAPQGGGPTYWLAFTRETVPEVRIAEGYLVLVPPAETEAGA